MHRLAIEGKVTRTGSGGRKSPFMYRVTGGTLGVVSGLQPAMLRSDWNGSACRSFN